MREEEVEEGGGRREEGEEGVYLYVHVGGEALDFLQKIVEVQPRGKLMVPVLVQRQKRVEVGCLVKKSRYEKEKEGERK
jgi:hypothetical protein